MGCPEGRVEFLEIEVAVTDPCIDWETTEALLREAAERFQKVREDMGL